MAWAVDRLVSVAVDDLDDTSISAELTGVERAVRRLQARSCALAAAATHRAAAMARAAAPDEPRAGERAAREAQRDLAGVLRWSPSQAKQAVRTGKRLASLPATRTAFDAGDLSAEHARILGHTLRHLVGDQRAALEAELVAAARDQDPVAFGRTCRARLAQADHDAAMGDERRRHGARRAAATQTPDGTVALSGQWAGLDGEVVLTAVHAFRRRDIDGEHRSAEQATADAVVDALRAALDAGTAPQRHGERPHVNVTIDWRDLLAEAGVAQAGYTGPIPVGEILHLLDDAGVARILIDADSLPTDVGRRSRTTPAGVWRGLVARDRGCTYPGCDAPPEWCQAAHMDRRWWQGAGTSVAEQALACPAHHRKLDREHWRARLDNGRVVWHPPEHTGRSTGGGSDPP